MKQVVASEKIPIKLWLDDIEKDALDQAKNLANLPFAFKHVAIMADSHSGFGMPIGGVLATKGAIIPNAVGVDIGCGMCALTTNLTDIDRGTLSNIVKDMREVIPVGFSHQSKAQEWKGFNNVPKISVIEREVESAKYQLGTLGGGNHFIEIQKGSDGFIRIMIHSGSRNLGYKVANYYNTVAVDNCTRWYSDIPSKDLAFLPISTDLAQDYLVSMIYCKEFAKENRRLMANRAEAVMRKYLKFDKIDYLDVSHNYVAIENHFENNVYVHRKGATSAKLGERGIIPGSMGAKSYIVQGKGTPDSFMSCSHGAGRKMGRNQAKKELDIQSEILKMGDIVHGLSGVNNLDEAPGAYKDIDIIMKNQEDLVSILVELAPLANLKG